MAQLGAPAPLTRSEISPALVTEAALTDETKVFHLVSDPPQRVCSRFNLNPQFSKYCSLQEKWVVHCTVPGTEITERLVFNGSIFWRSRYCECFNCRVIPFRANLEEDMHNVFHGHYFLDAYKRPLICIGNSTGKKPVETLEYFIDEKGNVGKYTFNSYQQHYLLDECILPKKFRCAATVNIKNIPSPSNITLKPYRIVKCRHLKCMIYFAKPLHLNDLEQFVFNPIDSRFERIKCEDCDHHRSLDFQLPPKFTEIEVVKTADGGHRMVTYVDKNQYLTWKCTDSVSKEYVEQVGNVGAIPRPFPDPNIDQTGLSATGTEVIGNMKIRWLKNEYGEVRPFEVKTMSTETFVPMTDTDVLKAKLCAAPPAAPPAAPRLSIDPICHKRLQDFVRSEIHRVVASFEQGVCLRPLRTSDLQAAPAPQQEDQTKQLADYLLLEGTDLYEQGGCPYQQENTSPQQGDYMCQLGAYVQQPETRPSQHGGYSYQGAPSPQQEGYPYQPGPHPYQQGAPPPQQGPYPSQQDTSPPQPRSPSQQRELNLARMAFLIKQEVIEREKRLEKEMETVRKLEEARAEANAAMDRELKSLELTKSAATRYSPTLLNITSEERIRLADELFKEITAGIPKQPWLTPFPPEDAPVIAEYNATENAAPSADADESVDPDPDSDVDFFDDDDIESDGSDGSDQSGDEDIAHIDGYHSPI